jgi:cytochrome c-type biogenesis protein CcmH
LLTLVGGPITQAKEAPPVAEDPRIEQRLNALATDLRCLVCQNESLAESRAPLALDLRREVRDQMRQGKDDQQVVAYLTERYGDFVLYRPPFKPETWLLWLGPPAFLLVGGAIWLLALRRRHGLRMEVLDRAGLAALEPEVSPAYTRAVFLPAKPCFPCRRLARRSRRSSASPIHRRRAMCWSVRSAWRATTPSFSRCSSATTYLAVADSIRV